MARGGNTQVLDQLSDTDSVLEPNSAAHSGGVAEPNRHLSLEDLEAYSTGQLAPARLDYCQAHLDSCEVCRDELVELRLLKSELAGFQRPESAQEPGRKKSRRGVTLTQAASVAAAVVVVGAAMFWWEHGRLWEVKTAGAMSAEHSLVASAAFAAHSMVASPGSDMSTERPASVAPSAPTAALKPATPPAPVAALPARVSAPAPIQHATAQLPLAKPIPAATASAPPHSVPPKANTSFALLGPFGAAISDTRPEFTWQPLPGALHYSVVIVDQGLHPVQHSPRLRKTAWRPRRPLRPGRTYLWQVTATLRGGSKVVASEPAASETLLRIAPPQARR